LLWLRRCRIPWTMARSVRCPFDGAPPLATAPTSVARSGSAAESAPCPSVILQLSPPSSLSLCRCTPL